MGITMFVSLYTTRLILNGLGASDFGIFNIVGGAIAMLGFLNAAMASATQRFMSYAEGEGNKEKQKYIFNISIVLHAAIAIIVGIALVGAGGFFFNGILTIPEDRVFAAEVVYASLIVSTMFTVLSVPYDAVLNAHENMRYYAIVGIIESFLKLAVAFACVYTSSDKLIVYGILMAAIPLVTLFIMFVYCHKHYEECILAPRRFYSKPLMKEMTGFAGWNFLGTASSMIAQYGMGVVLNHFWGTLLNAAQGIANQLSGVLMTFSNNMLKAVTPALTKAEGAKDKERMEMFALLGCKYSYFILFLFAFPAMIEMPKILNLWLKDVPDWAVIFCRLQLVRSLAEQLFGNMQNAIAANGNIKQFQKTRCLINISPIILSYGLFIYDFPPYWMYITWIFFWGLLGGIATVFYSNRYCEIEYSSFWASVLWPCTKVTSICFIAIVFTKVLSNSLYDFVFLNLIVTFTICMIFTIIWGTTKNERAIISSIINKLFKNHNTNAPAC